MVEESILYKLLDNKFHFCFYSIESSVKIGRNTDKEYCCFQYSQGEVGELHDFKVEIDQDISIIRGYKDEVVKTYNIRKIPSCEIEVSIYLERFLKEFGYDKFNPLYNHITNTIDFVSKSSGLGVNNFVVPSDTITLETGVYHIIVLVNDKDAFRRLFMDHITLCGIMIDEVKII